MNKCFTESFDLRLADSILMSFLFSDDDHFVSSSTKVKSNLTPIVSFGITLVRLRWMLLKSAVKISRWILSRLSSAKRERWKRCIVFLLFSLLFLNMCVLLQNSSSTLAYEVSLGEKPIHAFLTQVAGFNVTEGSDPYVPGFGHPRSPGSQHLETVAKIVVERDGRFFDTVTTLLDGRVWIFNSYDSVVLPEGKNVSECLEAARLAVTRYRDLFNASYAGGLVDMLSEAIANQRLTVDSPDALLNVTVKTNCSTPGDFQRFTTVDWYKKIAGQYVSDYQRISIDVSKEGLLTGFADELGVFHVATTNINVSKEQAANASTLFAEDYGEAHGQQIRWTTISLDWISDSESHRGDDFAVYPAWCFEALYNETKLGVYGYEVWIWADNAQISSNFPLGFIGGGESTKASDYTSLWLFFGAVAVVILIVCSGTYLKRRKSRRGESK